MEGDPKGSDAVVDAFGSTGVAILAGGVRTASTGDATPGDDSTPPVIGPDGNEQYRPGHRDVRRSADRRGRVPSWCIRFGIGTDSRPSGSRRHERCPPND